MMTPAHFQRGSGHLPAIERDRLATSAAIASTPPTAVDAVAVIAWEVLSHVSPTLPDACAKQFAVYGLAKRARLPSVYDVRLPSGLKRANARLDLWNHAARYGARRR